MSKQHDLLDVLARMDQLQDEKRTTVRELNEQIKTTKQAAVRLRSELEAEQGGKHERE